MYALVFDSVGAVAFGHAAEGETVRETMFHVNSTSPGPPIPVLVARLLPLPPDFLKQKTYYSEFSNFFCVASDLWI